MEGQPMPGQERTHRMSPPRARIAALGAARIAALAALAVAAMGAAGDEGRARAAQSEPAPAALTIDTRWTRDKPVISWNFGAESPGRFVSGSGEARFRPVTVRFRHDELSVKLLQAAMTQERIGEVELR